jgi:ABC-2 type transport system permease protein
MSASRSFLWFATFEARLAWRDLFSMMAASEKWRQRRLAIGLITLPIFMHGVAFLVLYFVGPGIRADRETFVLVTASFLVSGSALLAQAMESVTRTFYVRSDLDLILSAPVDAGKVFAVRIGTMALSAAFMSMLVIGPFINVLAWRSGIQWLSAYGVLVSIALTSTALAIVFTVSLIGLIGPKRTRLAAQIAAAIIGGMFVVVLQVSAMMSTGTLSRFAFLQSQFVLSHVPDLDSVFWLPARAALGDWHSLLFVFAASVLLFAAVTARYAPRFADFILAASSAAQPQPRAALRARDFRVVPIASALRLKERKLLLRDPWLISQSLMQLLYLIPPAILLWRGFGSSRGTPIVLVPVLIMTAGQLAGGLAWLTISGEDAPDLVQSAPVPLSGLLRAKVEAVLQCVGVVLLPFAALLTVVSLRQALAVALGGAAAAASSTTIQLWFRSQAKRSQFRRRHTSSRIASLSEALVTLVWSSAGAVATVSFGLAAIPMLVALAILFCVRSISPAR